MVKNNVGEWDTDADNNTDVGGINIAEFCPAANINNGMREMMAQTRGFYDRQTGEVNLRTGASYTAVVGDRSKLLNFAEGLPQTLNLPPAATLGNGWFVDISVVTTSAAQVTIDPDGSETVDGLQTRLVPRSTSLRLYCDGTGFFTVFPSARPELTLGASSNFRIDPQTGVLECWGTGTTLTTGPLTVNYPRAFTATPSVFVTGNVGGFQTSRQNSTEVTSMGLTSFAVRCVTQVEAGNTGLIDVFFTYYAIGRS